MTQSDLEQRQAVKDAEASLDGERRAGWNSLHDSALSLLSDGWTPWASLKAHNLPYNAFTDLCEWGAAERKTVPIMDGKTQRGEVSFFRRKS